MKWEKMKAELNRINTISINITKWFSLVSVLVLFAGVFAITFFKSADTAKSLLTLACVMMAEGVWGGVLTDCIKRRYE